MDFNRTFKGTIMIYSGTPKIRLMVPIRLKNFYWRYILGGKYRGLKLVLPIDCKPNKFRIWLMRNLGVLIYD